MRAKYTAKWGVQIAGMIFQTRSSPSDIQEFAHAKHGSFLAAVWDFHSKSAVTKKG
ncbi:DUF6783 domain-containing protein [Blautia acetigignens]|uniref:DUF6783 domain-containing protein n=1 Tax=Blautia acetigignens TaxID=2981783 RepID=A0ABV1CJU2_9FIRM